MIEPTVGRIVWYYEKANQKQPLPAMITWVHNDHRIGINIQRPDADLPVEHVKYITLLQDNEAVTSFPYATWMPYQKGQAAKTEELERLRDETITHTNKMEFEKVNPDRIPLPKALRKEGE